MEQYKKEFIEFMIDCNVLKFGDFVTKSGRKTPFFVNTGFYRTGAQLKRLGGYYAQAIKDKFGLDFDVLFGPAYKGIPLSVATTMEISDKFGADIKYCSNRKEVKDHGDTGILLGSPIADGDKVVIIEDVTTAGTSIEETLPMLSCMQERIAKLNTETDVITFGQEINPSTFGIAKADMMIRGGDPNNMRFGNTLSNDQFKGFTFDYVISNPPFGIDWKKEKDAVEKEHKLGDAGRFAPGLPKISDGQQLFVLNGLSKLSEHGKMAIIQNGSPLFSGDAESGPSEIRRYILENDWLDCIIQLGTDMFMNTGISTYIWVLNKDRSEKKTGKVLLIDASKCYEPRRKSIGTKRNDITDKCRELIVHAYSEYQNEKVYGDKDGIYCESKLFDTTEFGYNKITVERPQKDEKGNIVKDKKGNPVPDKDLQDTENIPMNEDIDSYFNREVLPYAPDAWYDPKKTKVGYEIPMTRYFYEYQATEKSEDIFSRITKLESEIGESLKAILGEK